jgi:hypothetical protein
MAHRVIAPAMPACLSCRKCRSHGFYAQMAESGSFLVLVCIGCTEPILFDVARLTEFPNPQHFVIEVQA